MSKVEAVIKFMNKHVVTICYYQGWEVIRIIG